MNVQTNSANPAMPLYVTAAGCLTPSRPLTLSERLRALTRLLEPGVRRSDLEQAWQAHTGGLSRATSPATLSSELHAYTAALTRQAQDTCAEAVRMHLFEVGADGVRTTTFDPLSGPVHLTLHPDTQSIYLLGETDYGPAQYDPAQFREVDEQTEAIINDLSEQFMRLELRPADPGAPCPLH